MVALRMLPGPARLAASCDASGACHVWSTTTGARLAWFAESGHSSAPATQGSSAWGRQQHTAGRVLSSNKSPSLGTTTLKMTVSYEMMKKQ